MRIMVNNKIVFVDQCNRRSLFTHAISNDHKIDWVNIKILTQENYYYKRKFLKSFYTNKCHSTMNIKPNEYFSLPYETI